MFHLIGILSSALGDKLAYLDPGSGSFLLQLLIAGLLGLGIALRASWSRIKKLFGGKTIKDDDDETDE
jgi:hypothetical protein